jgi:hypothetical protein
LHPLLSQAPNPQREEKKISKKQHAFLDFKMRSDYMRPFTSFYDPKGLDPAMNASQITRLEAMIAKEVEIALK